MFIYWHCQCFLENEKVKDDLSVNNCLNCDKYCSAKLDGKPSQVFWWWFKQICFVASKRYISFRHTLQSGPRTGHRPSEKVDPKPLEKAYAIPKFTVRVKNSIQTNLRANFTHDNSFFKITV